LPWRCPACATSAASVPRSFDGRGNYTLGLRDQLIFPEIDYAKVDKTKGMNVTIVTTAKDDDGARALLKGFGMPFRVGA
jgi:large subunit ribosomal protein L5